MTRLSLVLLLALLGACDKPSTSDAAPTTAPKSKADPAPAKTVEAPPPKPEGPEPPAATPASALERDPDRLPAPKRLVAIGDVHGDFEATRRVLKLVGAIDEQDNWVGGELVVVQTGDQLDRGDGEQRIVDLFEKLRPQAKAAGGYIVPLNGNHEIMNAQGDLRYVTPGGFTDFEDAIDPKLKEAPMLARAPAEMRARLAAFLPGGPYAKILATRNVAVIVGDTAFVHGGLRPAYNDLQKLNDATSRWLLGETQKAPEALLEPEGPIWTRKYSADVDAEACADLDVSLEKLGVQRMVVGHTVQAQGINSACDGKVWRIDVGLASHYGSAPSQALEIVGADVRVLAGDPK